MDNHETPISEGNPSHRDHAGDSMDSHEHPDYRPPRPLIRARATSTLRELVRDSHSDTDQAREVRERLSRTLREFAELDKLASESRRVLLGDPEIIQLAEEEFFVAASSTPQPARDVEHEGALFREPLHVEPWVYPSALLDVFLGASLMMPLDSRFERLEIIQERTLDALRVVSITMDIFSELPSGLAGQERFDQFLDQLGNFERFDSIPLELTDCIGELIEAIRKPDGNITRAAGIRMQELDDNSDRIASASPSPVCTGERLTLNARPGSLFVERPGVTVAFSPCGLLGTDIVWAQQTVEITVPQGAKSGTVYFVKQDESIEADFAASVGADLAAVFGNCPFLGLGSGNSLMVGAFSNPVAAQRCFLTNVGVIVTVIEAPRITRFLAVDQNGTPFTSQRRPHPSDLIQLEWEITGDPSTNPAIRLLKDGMEIAQGLALRDHTNLAPPQVSGTYTLEVASVCGVITQSLSLTVLRVLSFDPPNLSIDPGQSITLILKVDQPSTIPIQVMLTTIPAHPTAPGWVTIPAGQTQMTLTYPGLQTGEPFKPALELIAFSLGCTTAVGRVWVSAPLGAHRIVQDRTGSVTTSALDVVGVHAALLSDGTVLLFAYDESPATYFNINIGKSALWDPASNTVRTVPMFRNLFCAGHAFLGDGRLAVVGGQSTAIDDRPGFGVGKGADHDLHVFSSGAWTRVLPPNDMQHARWYPTCTTLPDGRVLILSGYASHSTSAINSDYEIFDQSLMLVQKASFMSLIPFNFEFDVYPFVQVLPNKNLFVHNHDTTWLLPLDSTNAPVIGSLGFTPLYLTNSSNTRTYNGQGACVILPLDPSQPTKASILVVGGGGATHGCVESTTTASNTAEIFDFDSSLALDAQPGWRVTRNSNGNQTFLTNPRLMADAVLLPDGTVAIIGGVGAGKADDSGPPIGWIESFDPSTGEFSSRTGITVPRLYHSTALLLPDGSVMIAGSTGAEWHYNLDGGSENEFRLEIYYPPYLFRGPRPNLVLTSTALAYGQQLSIEIPSGAAEIQKVALIRHSSTTHTNNMDQRYVGLQIMSRTATHVNVSLPADGSIAPPGPYLLFVIAADASGDLVPSRGNVTLLG